MNRRVVRLRPAGHCKARVAVAICALGMLSASPLPVAWQHWKYSRPIELPAADSTRLVSFALPQDVYSRAAPGLADLRVIDDSGAEAPYALDSREESPQSIPAFRPGILENSFSPGNYTQIVLNLGNYNAFHNSARIDTYETEFMEWVEIDSSDDAQTWRIVEQRAPIFRFSREGHAGTNVVRYSPNNARYLRVRILDGGKRFPVRSVEILANSVTKPQREPFDLKFLPAKPKAPNQSAWSADLGAGNAPLREMRFQVGPEEFVREVTIQSSRDGSRWFLVGTGEIFRFTQGHHGCEELSVAMSGTPERYLRVEIANGNDKPLEGVVPTLYIAAQRLVFEQKPGSSYRLLYGQSEAKPPQYDLARRLGWQRMDRALTVEAGPEETNSNWSDPRPWTETHSFVVWIGAGFAVLLLGYTAIQSLRRSSASG
jgi:Protein of unknown function (DUF3999)